MAKWIKAECSEKDGDANCSNCGHWDWSDCNYCSNCGEKMKDSEPIGFCEDCEYMHELVLKYDDQKILRPECWGVKNPVRVNYKDSCKDFKQRED